LSESVVKKPWEVKTYQITTRADNPDAAISIVEFSKLLPEFTVAKRIYWITNIGNEKDQFRGGHYHPKKQEILWVIAGSCRFVLRTSISEDELTITGADAKCLFIQPGVYHALYLEPGTIVAVASPRLYSPDEVADDDKYLEVRWDQ